MLAGKKYPSWKQASTIRKCRKGKLDAAVVSVKSGKNGCNLQGMSELQMNVTTNFGGFVSENEPTGEGFGSAQPPELRPSGVGTTRRRLGATLAPRLRRYRGLVL